MERYQRIGDEVLLLSNGLDTVASQLRTSANGVLRPALMGVNVHLPILKTANTRALKMRW